MCLRVGCDTAIDRFDQLNAAYAESARAYHTAQHIDECLQLLDSVASQLQSPVDVELAIWLHDVVYDPQAKDNETRSAGVAMEWLKDLPQARKDRLRQLILATQHHLPTPDDRDSQALLDIDLAILAAPPARFAQYSDQVRTEYGFVPEPLYQTKRAEFMHAMAQRPQLYFHPALAPRLEPLARRNLA